MSTTAFPSKAARWRGLLQEPLLHFMVLGALVFGVDAVLQSRQEDPNLIVVGPEVEQQARTLFRNAQGREPTAADMEILRQRWLDNEVLYREGLALSLDKGDEAMRERVIFKALSVIESNLRVPPSKEDALRAYFEQHRADYDEPERFDFLEAVLVGENSDAAAQRFAAMLNEEDEPEEVASGLRVFKGRPRNTIVDSFGTAFAAALAQLPYARWQVVSSKEGPRVVRLESRQPREAVEFDQVRERVREDHEDRQAQEQRTSAVRELAKKYKVRKVETSS